MFATSTLTISFLCSLREERTVVLYFSERFKCSVIDALSETIDIILLSDISKSLIAISDSPDSNASSSTNRNYQHN